MNPYAKTNSLNVESQGEFQKKFLSLRKSEINFNNLYEIVISQMFPSFV